MPLTLGIDASTQSCSALVIDTDDGRFAGEASVHFGEDLPDYGAPDGFLPGGENGEVHADPLMWVDALVLLLDRLSETCDLSRIAAISGAGQQHGAVCLNGEWPDALARLDPEQPLAGQIRPCLARATAPIWMDTSTAEECREIAEQLGGDAEVCRRSGSVATERFTGPQLRKFHKTDPDAYAATRRVHLVSSFLCALLCQRDVPVDTGDAAGMNLLNIDHWQWDPALLEATAPGLAEKLPPVRGGGTPAGVVGPWFRERYGFADDVPVVVFTGDNPSSLVGMGAARPGKVVVSLGTSDTFFAAMPGSVADPGGAGHVFGNPAGGAMSLQCFINGSLARETVRDRFGYDWDAVTRALRDTPPGNGGRLMVPFFRPEISPRVDTGGPLLKGGAAFESWEEPEAAQRACVEGQFLNMRSCTAWMGLSTDTIHLTGGASRNDAIAQVLADVFQARVERLEVSGSVALGAALRAAATGLGQNLDDLCAEFCKPAPDGAISPDPQTADLYTDALRAFEQLRPGP